MEPPAPPAAPPAPPIPIPPIPIPPEPLLDMLVDPDELELLLALELPAIPLDVTLAPASPPLPEEPRPGVPDESSQPAVKTAHATKQENAPKTHPKGRRRIEVCMIITEAMDSPGPEKIQDAQGTKPLHILGAIRRSPSSGFALWLPRSVCRPPNRLPHPPLRYVRTLSAVETQIKIALEVHGCSMDYELVFA